MYNVIHFITRAQDNRALEPIFLNCTALNGKIILFQKLSSFKFNVKFSVRQFVPAKQTSQHLMSSVDQ